MMLVTILMIHPVDQMTPTSLETCDYDEHLSVLYLSIYTLCHSVVHVCTYVYTRTVHTYMHVLTVRTYVHILTYPGWP